MRRPLLVRVSAAAVMLTSIFAMGDMSVNAADGGLLTDPKKLAVCENTYPADYSYVVTIPYKAERFSSTQVIVWKCDGHAPIFVENGNEYCRRAVNSVSNLAPVVKKSWFGLVTSFVGYTCKW